MAAYYNKVSIETPVYPMREFDLSCQHMTTSNFMQTNIVYAREFPKVNIKCNLKSFARMMPLLKPVLGSVQCHNRAFWIPFRVVWDPWSAFIVDAPYITDSGARVFNSVPLVDNNTLQNFIISHSVQVTDPNAAFDYDVNGTHYNLDSDGRLFMKQLEALGYKIIFGLKAQTEYYSFLPILCFAKAFFDWYLPPQYVHTGSSAVVEGIFNRNFLYEASIGDLQAIFAMCALVAYDSDYFTTAYDSPTAPSASTYSSDFRIPDISNNANNSGNPRNEMVTNDNTGNLSPYSTDFRPSNGTPYVAGTFGTSSVGYSGVAGVFTQYVDDSLKALTNYLKRHQLVGARVLDRYIADFGVQLSAEKLKRCIYCGKQTFPIQFSDVMATSDTATSNSGAALGDYAGKGIAFDGQGNFKCESDEFGMFIILSSIVPDIAYYQGIDRQVIHKRKLDFINGEFMKLGTQPISKAELIVSRKNATMNGVGNGQTDILQQIFGFTARYAEYRTSRDLITGDFCNDSLNLGLQGWSTKRQIADDSSVTSAPAHSYAFCVGMDWKQYNRIFYGVTEGDDDIADKFIFVHRINLSASMEAPRLFDTYDFDEEQGKKILMQSNGVQVN